MRGKFTLPFSVVCKKGPALKHMLRHQHICLLSGRTYQKICFRYFKYINIKYEHLYFDIWKIIIFENYVAIVNDIAFQQNQVNLKLREKHPFQEAQVVFGLTVFKTSVCKTFFEDNLCSNCDLQQYFAFILKEPASNDYDEILV